VGLRIGQGVVERAEGKNERGLLNTEGEASVSATVSPNVYQKEWFGGT